MKCNPIINKFYKDFIKNGIKNPELARNWLGIGPELAWNWPGIGLELAWN